MEEVSSDESEEDENSEESEIGDVSPSKQPNALSARSTMSSWRPLDLDEVRSRILAAVSANGGNTNFAEAFEECDPLGSGELEVGEVLFACRDELEIPMSAVSDAELIKMCSSLADAGSGKVGILHLVGFLEAETATTPAVNPTVSQSEPPQLPRRTAADTTSENLTASLSESPQLQRRRAGATSSANPIVSLSESPPAQRRMAAATTSESLTVSLSESPQLRRRAAAATSSPNPTVSLSDAPQPQRSTATSFTVSLSGSLKSPQSQRHTAATTSTVALTDSPSESLQLQRRTEATTSAIDLSETPSESPQRQRRTTQFQEVEGRKSELLEPESTSSGQQASPSQLDRPTRRKKTGLLKHEALEQVRSKLKAAAYTGQSGCQLEVIFSRFDKDGSGQLEDDEVIRAMRHTLRIPPEVLSNAEISALCNVLDADNSGTVSVKELVDFVGPPPEVSKRTGRSFSEAGVRKSLYDSPTPARSSTSPPHTPRENKPRKRGPPLKADAIEQVRSKLKAAAYTGHAGRQVHVLFGRFDRDGSGELGDDEVQRALRHTLKIPAAVISNEEISSLCALLDTDNSGTVSIEEIAKFIGEDADTASAAYRSRVQNAEASPEKKKQEGLHDELSPSMQSTAPSSAWPTPNCTPRDPAKWAAQTWSQMNNVRALRQAQEVESQMLRTMHYERHGSTQKEWHTPRHRATAVQNEKKKANTNTEQLAKVLLDRVERTENVLREVRQSVLHLQAARTTRCAQLNVAERRLELRTQRPASELVRDQLQEALEQEQQVLRDVCQQMSDQVQVNKGIAHDLEDLKEEMFLSVQKKRQEDRKHALPRLHHTSRHGGTETPDIDATPPQQFSKDVTKFITKARALEETANRAVLSGSNLLRRVETEVDRVAARTTASLRRRLDETSQIRRQLEKEIKETENTINEAGWSVEKVQRRLERGGGAQEEKEVLQEQFQRTKDVLERLNSAQRRLQADLQCKNAAWRVDDACSKVTPGKGAQNQREADGAPSPRKPADVELPSLRKRARLLEPDSLEKVRSRIKAAAYTGHTGRQLDVIFGRFDADHSGQLGEDEIRRALRRTLRIPQSVISDDEISSLYAMLDSDKSGSVSISEIVDFVGAEPEVSKRTGRLLPGVTSEGSPRNDVSKVPTPTASPTSARVPPPAAQPTPRKRGSPLKPEVLDKLRSKIKAASYTGTSGRQLEVALARFDRDGSGQLDDDEVHRALRRTLRIPKSVISDADISSLCATLDADNSGLISVDEIIAFVGADSSVSQRTGRTLNTRLVPINAD